MARLLTAGCEFLSPVLDDLFNVGGAGGTLSQDTTVKRGGRASHKITLAAGQSNHRIRTPNFTTVLDRTKYLRTYVYFDAWPSVASTLVVAANTTVVDTFSALVVTATGMLQTEQGTNHDVGQLSLNTWHRVELRAVKVTSPTNQIQWAARLDGGTEVAGDSFTSTNNPNYFWLGMAHAESVGINLNLDDIAVNDDTGADQNGYPGPGKVLGAVPVSDSAVGADWKLGAGTTPSGNAFASVDNTPPTGKSSSPGDGDQIRDAVSNTAGPNADADFAMQSCDDLGIPSGSTITVMQTVAGVGPLAAAALAAHLERLSNPAGPGADVTTAAITVGAWSSQWTIFKEAHTHSPAVTPSTRPVVRIGKRTASATALACAILGIQVEYVESSSQLAAAAASAVASATLALTAPGVLAAAAASGVASGSVTLIAPPRLAAAASAVASATLALGAGGQPVAVAPASAVASASLTLTAPVVAAPTGPANPVSMML